MPLYTDMVADNIEDYARGGRDGELKLQNMPEDASLEAWAAKLQEIADEKNMSLEDVFIKYMDLASVVSAKQDAMVKEELDEKILDFTEY